MHHCHLVYLSCKQNMGVSAFQKEKELSPIALTEMPFFAKKCNLHFTTQKILFRKEETIVYKVYCMTSLIFTWHLHGTILYVWYKPHEFLFLSWLRSATTSVLESSFEQMKSLVALLKYWVEKQNSRFLVLSCYFCASVCRHYKRYIKHSMFAVFPMAQDQNLFR